MSAADASQSGEKAPDALASLLGNPALRRVLAAIDLEGEETRIVGGAVRDSLLGRPVKEIDLATTAGPELVIARAGAAGIRTILTGLAHGTITLLVDGDAFEVTSLREDVETDGRRAQVRFGRDFRSDAMRRDFTINALFLAKDGRIFDYVGGLADIAARRVRFIGDPSQRIQEDYLRILRFFRFAADFGQGALDAEGVRAAMRARGGLARLSRERVRAELLKLLAAPRAAEAAQEMCDAGLLGPLLASAPNPARLRALAKIDDEAVRDPLLRLAALCLDLPEDADRLGRRLRLSNAERQRLARAASILIELHGRVEASPDAELRRLLFLHGREAAQDALRLAAIRAPDPAHWAEALAFLREAAEPRLPFSGADLIARGLASGRAIGEALEVLKLRWIGAGFPDNPRELAKLLDDVVADAP
jgi:poly(A) polymerase